MEHQGGTAGEVDLLFYRHIRNLDRGIPLGYNEYRNDRVPYGIMNETRFLHTYIVGGTGQGKTNLLQVMMLGDLYSGRGFTCIDPHGDLSDFILAHCGPSFADRMEDVVYLDPSDVEWPFAFNLLECHREEDKAKIASDVVSVFRRMYISLGWGPRLEDLLRNGLLLLLDNPNTTLIDLVRILTQPLMRDQMLANCTNPTVRAFWEQEFSAWTESSQSQAVAPVLNKVRTFLVYPPMRNILGQPRSTFNFLDIMNTNKVVILKLASTAIGAENAQLLGSLVVGEEWRTAIARPAGARNPHHLYVDEFQTFVTDSFAEILTQARKFRLSLTLAHQYVSQIPDTIATAVLENAGTKIVFNSGEKTARIMGPYFRPIEPRHILGLPRFHAYVATLGGAGGTDKLPPILTRVFPPLDGNAAEGELVKRYSQSRFCRPREDVVKELQEKVAEMGDTLEKVLFKDDGEEGEAYGGQFPLQ